MRKKTVLVVAVILGGLLLGFGALLTTNMGTAFIGRVLVEQARTHLDAALTFQGLRGNPLRGYTIENLGLFKEGVPLVRMRQGFVKVKLMPLLKKSFELDRIELRDFQVFPQELAPFVEPLRDLPPEFLRPVQGAHLELHQQGDTFSLMGQLQYGTLPLEGEGVFQVAHSPQGRGIERVEMLRAEINLAAGGFRAEGLLFPHFDLRGELQTANLEAFLKALDIPQGAGLALPLTAFLELSGTGAEDLALSGRLLTESGVLFGVPLGVSVCDFTWAENRLEMQIPEFRPGGIPFQGYGSYQFYEKPGVALPGVFSLFLSAENIPLEELRSMLPAASDIPLGGTVEQGTIQITGKDGDFQGDAQIYAPRVSLGDESFSELRMQIKLREQNTLHITARGEGWGGSLALSGKGSLPGPSLDLSFNSKGLRLERLQKFIPPLQGYPLRGDIHLGGTLRGKPGSLVIAGELQSPKLALFHTFIDDLRIPYSYREKEQSLALQKATARIEQGSLHLDGVLRNLKAASPTAEGVLELRQVPLVSLGSWFPEMKDAGLKGELTMKASFRGPLNAPALEGAAYVPLLTLPDGTVLRHAKGDVALASGEMPKLLAGQIKELPFTLTAADIRHPSGALLENPRGELAWNFAEQKLRIARLESRMGKATLQGRGEMTLADPAAKSVFRLELGGENLDISRLYVTDAGAMPLQGTARMGITAQGTFEKPRFDVQISAPKVRYDTLTLEQIILGGEGGLEGFTLSEARGSLYGGTINLSGGVRFKGDALETDLRAEWANLSLPALGRDFPKLKDLETQGVLSGTFALKGAPENLRGSGSATIPQLGLFGLKAEQVVLPLAFEKNTLAITAGKANLYGGTLGANFTANFVTGAWRSDARGELVSMGPLLRDLTRSDKGLHCNGVLDFKGAGNFLSGAVRGEGSFATSKGHLTGVPWADLMAKLHGGRRVSFEKISGSYELDAYRFLLRSGEVQPEPGDPLYQSLRASGPISYEGPMNIAVEGMVNVQLVNALAGGTAGGVAGLIQNPGSLEGILQGVLGGVTDMGKSRDFRKVTFTLEGTAKNPVMKNLKMDRPQPTPGTPVIAIPETPQPGTPPSPTQAPQSLEEKVKEELTKEILKLFE
jgi:hypothetical protein